MKKVLFVASVTSHIRAFHIPYLKMFKDAGYEVHLASKGEESLEYVDKHFNVNFSREPINKDNIGAYKELKKIIEEGEYEVVQCNTPAASVITRLAAKKARKKGTRMIYMAHGFHFFKGAPLKNWIFYYSIEKFLSKYTDDLITINDEDYEIASKKFKAKNIHHIHGIGINKSQFDITISDEEKNELRNSLNLKENDFVILYVGELIDRKNQKMLIEAMKGLDDNYKLLLVGNGKSKEDYEKIINENNLNNKVYLLGFRKDVPKLLKIANIYVATSKMEGLPINILEARGAGLPIIVTNSRGQRELVQDNENGFIIELGDIETLKEKIQLLYENEELRNKFIKNSKNNIEKYCLENVYEEIKEIYIK